MRTVNPEIWTKKLKKKVPSSMASFLMRNRHDSIAGTPTTQEKIFRKSVRDVVMEFLKHSSITGTKIVVDERRHTSERIFFCVLIIAGIMAAATTAVFTLFGAVKRPLVVTLETMQYPPTAFPFPAVALCSVNLISKRAALNFTKYLLQKAYISRNFHRIRPLPKEEEVYEWMRRVGYLYDYQLEDYSQLKALSKLFRKNLAMSTDSDILKQLEPKCEDMLVRCSWHGNDVNCMELFQFKKTAYGHCCTFNYVKKHNHRGLPYDIFREPYVLSSKGAGNGLSVILNADIDDYAYQKQNTIGTNVQYFKHLKFINFVNDETFNMRWIRVSSDCSASQIVDPMKKVLIFNSMDYPDPTSGSLTTHMTLANRTVYLNIAASVQYSAWKVRQWGLEKRGCLFRSELEEFHGHYSYSECLTACKLRTALNLCHCAPFNLPAGGHTKCDFSHIPCLHKHKALGFKVRLVLECGPCPSSPLSASRAGDGGGLTGRAAQHFARHTSEKFLYLFPNRPDQMALLEESQNSLFCPECFPDCENIQYNVRHHVTRSVGRADSFRSNFTFGVDLTNKTVIHAYYSSDDHVLYKMDVTLHWFEFVSILGNVSYLFAGISVFSFLELVYFCFYRFFVIWNKNKKRYFNKSV